MPRGRAHLASSSRALGMALGWSSHISIASSPASASPPCQKEHLVEALSALGLLGHLAASLPCCHFFLFMDVASLGMVSPFALAFCYNLECSFSAL